jgi:hypothetical protein
MGEGYNGAPIGKHAPGIPDDGNWVVVGRIEKSSINWNRGISTLPNNPLNRPFPPLYTV